jgi:hypothetical protein
MPRDTRPFNTLPPKHLLETDDPLKTVLVDVEGLCVQLLDSKKESLSIRNRRGWENRKRWRRGFSQCRICKSKLMYYLEKGRSLKQVMSALHKQHPEIKNIRKFTMNVIRETTGFGYFDDYIVENKLWNVRCPILAPPHIKQQLVYMWVLLDFEGESRTKRDKLISHHMKTGTKTGDLLAHVIRTRKLDRGL